MPLKHASVDKKNPNRYNIYASALTRKGALVIADAADIHFIKAELIVRGMLSGNALEEVNKVITKYNAADAETAVTDFGTHCNASSHYLACVASELRTLDVVWNKVLRLQCGNNAKLNGCLYLKRNWKTSPNSVRRRAYFLLI